MSRVKVSTWDSKNNGSPRYSLYWESDSGKETGGFHGPSRSYKTVAGVEKAGRTMAKKLRMEYGGF